MKLTQRKAFIGLVALTLAAATPVLAQDTTSAGRAPQPGRTDSLTMPGQGGGADTSGFAGMERNDPSGARAPAAQDTAGGVETGAVRTETAPPADARAPAAAPSGEAAGQSRDPNGFRWTEPGDFARAGQTPPVGATGAVQEKQPKDSLSMPGQGGAADTAGYSGMERDSSKAKHKEHKPGTSDSIKP
jgi:hypothetical protein